MKVILLDTKTGARSYGADGLTSFSWTDNNWSCDCNRHQTFELSGEDEEYYDGWGTCFGCHRFLVVDAEVDMEDDWDNLSLRELNGGYQESLLSQHGIDPNFIVTKDHKLTPLL
jgi:hypothetical protein